MLAFDPLVRDRTATIFMSFCKSICMLSRGAFITRKVISASPPQKCSGVSTDTLNLYFTTSHQSRPRPLLPRKVSCRVWAVAENAGSSRKQAVIRYFIRFGGRLADLASPEG